MKSMPVAVRSALVLSLIGLLAAWGIGICAPTTAGQRPDFERVMFILLPTGGAVLGWFLGYLATPFRSEQ